MKFKNANHFPSIPKSYKGTLPNGELFKIPWPNNIPFGSFYQSVVRFHEANGMTAPDAATVEDYICHQLPSHWCVGNEVYIAPAPARAPCKGCGRW